MIKWTTTYRRGISTVVGALFFLVLMTSSLSAVFLALDTQNEIINSQQSVTKNEIKKIREQYSISVSTDPLNDNKLSVLVKNEGAYPVEISRLWIINKTDAANDYPAKAFNLTGIDTVIPPGYGADIVSNQELHMISDTYDVKVISTLGTIHKQELSAGGNNNLRAELLTIPPDVRVGENVTIALHVTNIGKSKLFNVTASTPNITPASGVTLPLPTNPLSVNLNPSESIFFGWEYTTDGTPGTIVTFFGNASGIEDGTGLDFTSNNAVEKITLREDKGGSGDQIVLTQDLLARPEIFLIIPSPQGDSNSKALWGVNVVNPTNATMEISKLTITAFAPGANNNDKIFGSSCASENIKPIGTNHWSCPSENVIMWQSLTNPVVLSPYSVQPFLTRILPGTIAGQNILESVIVQASVFTTVGSFGKADYQTTMFDGTETIGNVYLSDVVDSRSNADINSARLGISSNSIETFNIVFADMDSESSTTIKTGAKLIINVPKGWTNVEITGNSGFKDPPIVNNFGDGSTQIIAETSAPLGDADNPADTITFTAQAPDVTNDQMYVMYILAEGESSNDFAIGPLSEIVLQVTAP